MIEVKTKLTNYSLREALNKLADNAAKIRRDSHNHLFRTGLFVYEPDSLTPAQILRALQAAAEGQEERAINFVSVGNNFFAQYSEYDIGSRGETPPLWYLYDLQDLASAYFLSHFVWRMTKERPQETRFAWFPLRGEVRNMAHFVISLHGGTVREIPTPE